MQITSKNTIKNIEDIVPGDYVLAYNHVNDKKEVREVLEIFRPKVPENSQRCIQMKNGDSFVCSSSHQMFVIGKGYVKVEDILPGDNFLDINGNSIEVEGIYENKNFLSETFYDFEVDTLSNYFVEGISKNSYLSHNCTNHFPIWHYDIEDLIVLKNNQGSDDSRVRHIDHSVQLSGLFYQRYIENKSITLFSPNDVPDLYKHWGMSEFDDLYKSYEKKKGINKKKINARTLFHHILAERFETGRLYIQNIDHCNYHSHTSLQVTMSNLCVDSSTRIDIKIGENTLENITIKFLQTYLDENEEVGIRSYNLVSRETEYQKILDFKKTGVNQDLIKIEWKYDDGSSQSGVYVTPEHEIYTSNRGYIKAHELEIDKDKVICTSIDSNKNYRVREATVTKLEFIKAGTYHELGDEVYDITVENNNNFFANNVLVHNCQEILLPTTPINHIDDNIEGRIATCILSALNLGNIKFSEYEKICDLAVRALDQLIDYQGYPIKSAEAYTKEQRSLGIGVINFAYLLTKNKLKWESKEAYELTHKVFEKIQYYCLKSSCNLAKEKGEAPGFNTSKYDSGILPIDTYNKFVDSLAEPVYEEDWESLRKEIKIHGLRNVCMTAIAPTESSSVTSGATNGIEPPRESLTIKLSKKGNLKMIVPEYSKLKNNYELLWDMKDNKGYLNNVAVMQKFIDQSISTNTSYNPLHYLEETVTLSSLVQDLFYAYKLGIKTLYYNNTYDSNENDKKDEVEVCGACKI